jgi:hypothetical protein
LFPFPLCDIELEGKLLAAEVALLATSLIASSELMIPMKLIVVPCAIFIPVGRPTTEAHGLVLPKEL